MIIHLENYSFKDEYFHSAGLVRVDPRGKGEVLQNIKDKVVPDEFKWPLRLQLYLVLPNETAGMVKVLNLKSHSGELGTMEMYKSLHAQLRREHDDRQSMSKLPKTDEWEPTRQFLEEMLKIAIPGPTREGGDLK